MKDAPFLVSDVTLWHSLGAHYSSTVTSTLMGVKAGVQCASDSFHPGAFCASTCSPSTLMRSSCLKYLVVALHG